VPIKQQSGDFNSLEEGPQYQCQQDSQGRNYVTVGESQQQFFWGPDADTSDPNQAYYLTCPPVDRSLVSDSRTRFCCSYAPQSDQLNSFNFTTIDDCCDVSGKHVPVPHTQYTSANTYRELPDESGRIYVNRPWYWSSYLTYDSGVVQTLEAQQTFSIKGVQGPLNGLYCNNAISDSSHLEVTLLTQSDEFNYASVCPLANNVLVFNKDNELSKILQPPSSDAAQSFASIGVFEAPDGRLVINTAVSASDPSLPTTPLNVIKSLLHIFDKNLDYVCRVPGASPATIPIADSFLATVTTIPIVVSTKDCSTTTIDVGFGTTRLSASSTLVALDGKGRFLIIDAFSTTFFFIDFDTTAKSYTVQTYQPKSICSRPLLGYSPTTKVVFFRDGSFLVGCFGCGYLAAFQPSRVTPTFEINDESVLGLGEWIY